MEIQTALTIAAGCMVAVAVMMLAVCLKFTSAVKGLLEKQTEMNTAPVPSAQAYAPTASPAEPLPAVPALHGVDEPTAAMLMAVVAAEIGTAPDELHFISIKEC